MGVLKLLRRKKNKQQKAGKEPKSDDASPSTTASSSVNTKECLGNEPFLMAEQSCNAPSLSVQQESRKPSPLLLPVIDHSSTPAYYDGSVVPLSSSAAQNHNQQQQQASDLLLSSNPPPPPSCSNSSLRNRKQMPGKNKHTPSVHFSPRHVVISSESSALDLTRALADVDEEDMTHEASTLATFKTNNSESSLQYLWRYITCNLGTKSTFDLRFEDDLTIESDLVTAWTGRTDGTDRTGVTTESLNQQKKGVTWSAAS